MVALMAVLQAAGGVVACSVGKAAATAVQVASPAVAVAAATVQAESRRDHRQM